MLDGRYVSPGFALAATFEPARFHRAAKAAGLPADAAHAAGPRMRDAGEKLKDKSGA